MADFRSKSAIVFVARLPIAALGAEAGAEELHGVKFRLWTLWGESRKERIAGFRIGRHPEASRFASNMGKVDPKISWVPWLVLGVSTSTAKFNSNKLQVRRVCNILARLRTRHFGSIVEQRQSMTHRSRLVLIRLC